MEAVGRSARSGNIRARVASLAQSSSADESRRPRLSQGGGAGADRSSLLAPVVAGPQPQSHQRRFNHPWRRIHDSTNRGQRVTSWSVSRNP